MILPLFLGLISCDPSSKGGGESQSGSTHASDEEIAELHDRSAIKGDDWTLARLSDFFDESLTPEKVMDVMGPNPFIDEDGSEVEFKYEVLSRDRFQNGCRVSTVSMVFRDGKFLFGEVGMTGVSSPSSE